MRVLITGAAGMLGAAVVAAFGADHQVTALTRAEVDVTDGPRVKRVLAAARPDLVLHLAAWTDVDGCERDVAKATAVNATATATIADYCATQHVTLLLMSSIAVFDGRQSRPYSEVDQPAPINVYGRTKWQAEQLARQVPRHFVVRSGWLFGGGERDKKFVPLILRLAKDQTVVPVVADCFGSPTYVVDLAAGLRRLVTRGVDYGTYHMVNEGDPVSRLALAREIVRLRGLNVALKGVDSDYFPHLAPRPHMEAACSQKVTGWLRPWPLALAGYLRP